jgi:hypothetical protein
VASGLIFTAVVAVVVMQSISSTYEARGSVLVVSPLPPTEETPSILSQNPFARFDASTSVLAGVAAQLMDDISVRERLQEEGAKGDYVVVQENSSAPILTVIVEDEDEEFALTSASIVLSAINDELNDRQADAGAPEASRIRSLVISAPTRTTRLVAARVRAGVATVLLGSAAALSMAFVVEGFAQSRSQRQQAQARERAGSREHEPDEASGETPPRARASSAALPPTDPTPSEQFTSSSPTTT